jgi:hypothetical protein
MNVNTTPNFDTVTEFGTAMDSGVPEFTVVSVWLWICRAGINITPSGVSNVLRRAAENRKTGLAS